MESIICFLTNISINISAGAIFHQKIASSTFKPGSRKLERFMLLLYLPRETPSILTVERLGVFEFFWRASSGPFGWIFDRKGTTNTVNLSWRAFCSSSESRAMRFFGGRSLRSWCRSKNLFHPCPPIKRNSEQRTQNRSKYHF